MKEDFNTRVRRLYLAYSEEYEKDMESLRGVSGVFWAKMSFEQYAYTQTRMYKLKLWFRNCWIMRRYRNTKYKIGTIWDVIFNIH